MRGSRSSARRALPPFDGVDLGEGADRDGVTVPPSGWRQGATSLNRDLTQPVSGTEPSTTRPRARGRHTPGTRRNHVHGAAKESNLPTLGRPGPAGFEGPDLQA